MPYSDVSAVADEPSVPAEEQQLIAGSQRRARDTLLVG